MDWHGDDISLHVWAHVGRADDDQIDEVPETVIDRLRAGGGVDQAAHETGLEGVARPLLVAMAWAGVARVATVRRNEALRVCRAEGAPLRALGEATRLSHTAISKITGT